MKYKNLLFASSLEIMFGLITSLLIIIIGPGAISFLAFFAIRPLILERENLPLQNEYWFYSFQFGKYTLFILSIIIIIFYLLDEFILSKDILITYRNRVVILIPFYLLVHGTLVFMSWKRLE